MITASFYMNKDAGSITLAVSGHAGAAKKGEDIVCAASSILAYTVAQTLQFMYEEGGLQKKPHLKMDEGDCVITVKPKPEKYVEALHTFFVAQVGFHLLSRSYPKFVDIEPFHVGESESS